MKKIILIIFLFFSFQCFASEKIDINEASQKELEKITGVGPVLAERIIEERPFNSLNQLTEVKGIGEVTLKNIKEEGYAFVSEKENYVPEKEVYQKESIIEEKNSSKEPLPEKEVLPKENPFFLFLTSLSVAIFSSFVIVILKKKL